MQLDPEQDRKRKRTSSGGSTLTSQHVTDNLHRYGEIILHCTVNITRGIRDCGNGVVLKYVCALLNSGGGILHMRNLDAERGVVLSKHLDTWWSGMEIKMAEILSRDDICNYFDLVGNHDDKHLYLFVKTAEHLCSLTYHCRLPTDTATHEVTYQSLLRLMVNHGEPGTLLELPPIPGKYEYGKVAEELKKETKQIQFKQLATPQNKSSGGKNTLPERVCSLMIKYVSAFANHEGGHIYYGIGDTRASVYGEELSLPDQKNLEWLITQRMHNMVWRDSSVRTVRGVHWDIKFFPVSNVPKKGYRVVVVVSVVKFPGGVFTSCPASSYINADGRVVDFNFDDWKEAVLNPLRDVPELHHRFHKLSLMVPRAPLVFTLPNTIDTIKNKVILAKLDDIQPRQYIESYTDLSQREAIRTVLNLFKGSNSVCIGMECWGLKIPMMPCNEVLCDVAIVAEGDGVKVLTFALSRSDRVMHHSQTAATVLKNKIVQFGGCTEKFSVISNVLDISQNNVLEDLEKQLATSDIYPSHFCSNKRKIDKVLNSLIICMGSYLARSQALDSMNQHGSYHFLLTHDQFELLWTQQHTRELWVHGPSGTGKTVAAIQMIQELRRRGCCCDNILYLAENEKLCEFVRSHNQCLVTTRRELLADSSNADLMEKKYGRVCNVVVDEAQNFKDWDGDWYSLAEKLANQKPPSNLPRCSNYFWVFMDYAQKVHKFKAGLPTVIGKNNFMLSEVSRSTKEIFDFTSRLMMAAEDAENVCNPVFQHVQSIPTLAHRYSSGKGVDIMSCKETEIKNVLNKVLSGLLKTGIQENDIAILVGKRSELERLRSTLDEVRLDESHRPYGGAREDEMTTRKSVEEHLQKCGSDASVVKRLATAKKAAKSDSSGSSYYEDISDDSMDEFDMMETSNPFAMLSADSSGDHLETRDSPDSVSMDTSSIASSEERAPVKFYRNESEFEESSVEGDTTRKASLNNNSVTKETGVTIDTVRRFSGLDKAAVIGINPTVNEEHADFKKFLLSLATRAKDNLVVITTSDNIKEKLEKLV